MKTFTIHEQPDPPGDRIDRAEALLFIADGFSAQAAVLAPLWMIGHGMWLICAGYAGSVLALMLLGWLGLPAAIIGLCVLGLHVAIGFEAASLRRWTLERKGWQSLGAVTGESEIQCERRFLDTWLAETHSRSVAVTSTAGLSRAW